MIALFIGGIKSGKSKNAEIFTLKHSTTKPFYIATNELYDDEMVGKIAQHKIQREDNFITIEEPLALLDVIQELDDVVLVESVSMWINNMLFHHKTSLEIKKEIKTICSLSKKIVFVVDDVSCSVVSEHKSVREFCNINGEISQILAQYCDEVYHVVAGLSVQIK